MDACFGLSDDVESSQEVSMILAEAVGPCPTTPPKSLQLPAKPVSEGDLETPEGKANNPVSEGYLEIPEGKATTVTFTWPRLDGPAVAAAERLVGKAVGAAVGAGHEASEVVKGNTEHCKPGKDQGEMSKGKSKGKQGASDKANPKGNSKGRNAKCTSSKVKGKAKGKAKMKVKGKGKVQKAEKSMAKAKAKVLKEAKSCQLVPLTIVDMGFSMVVSRPAGAVAQSCPDWCCPSCPHWCHPLSVTPLVAPVGAPHWCPSFWCSHAFCWLSPLCSGVSATSCVHGAGPPAIGLLGEMCCWGNPLAEAAVTWAGIRTPRHDLEMHHSIIQQCEQEDISVTKSTRRAYYNFHKQKMLELRAESPGATNGYLLRLANESWKEHQEDNTWGHVCQ